MPTDFELVFLSLRSILQKHRGRWTVTEDSPTCYSLAGNVGPAALQSWGGKMRQPRIPVGSVQIGKAYVSYHLMGLYGNRTVVDGLSKELKVRMQGKTCFNFKREDAGLFQELDRVTRKSIDGLKQAGFVTEP